MPIYISGYDDVVNVSYQQNPADYISAIFAHRSAVLHGVFVNSSCYFVSDPD